MSNASRIVRRNAWKEAHPLADRPTQPLAEKPTQTVKPMRRTKDSLRGHNAWRVFKRPRTGGDIADYLRAESPKETT